MAAADEDFFLVSETVSMKDFIEISCPNCLRTRKARREWLGRKTQCSCGNEFVLAYPAVKKAEVEKSPAVKSGKKSKARNKRIQPTEIKKSVFSKSLNQQVKDLKIPVEEISAIRTNRGWSLDEVLYIKRPEIIAKKFYISQGYSCEYGENYTFELLMQALLYPLLVKYNVPLGFSYKDTTTERSVYENPTTGIVADVEFTSLTLLVFQSKLRDLINNKPREVIYTISHSNERHLRKGLRAIFRYDEFGNKPLSDAHLIKLWKLLGRKTIHGLAKCYVTNIGYIGWPDLTLIRDSKVTFAEVKTVDNLKSSQIEWWLKVAKPLGLNFQITRLKKIAK